MPLLFLIVNALCRLPCVDRRKRIKTSFNSLYGPRTMIAFVSRHLFYIRLRAHVSSSTRYCISVKALFGRIFQFLSFPFSPPKDMISLVWQKAAVRKSGVRFIPDLRCHLASTFIVDLRQSFECRRERCLSYGILGRCVVLFLDHYSDEIKYKLVALTQFLRVFLFVHRRLKIVFRKWKLHIARSAKQVLSSFWLHVYQNLMFQITFHLNSDGIVFHLWLY